MRATKSLYSAIQNRETTPYGHFVQGSVVKAQYQYPTYKNVEVLKSNGRKKTIVHAANFP
jgi:hypothetical protein